MTARFGLPPAAWRLAAAGGVIVGAVYALSPLTVWFVLAMMLLVRWAVKGLDGGERRWLLALLIVAIALRVMAIAGLFAVTNHATTPFGVFFGDEEYYIRRSIWMRNLALGLPLHTADMIYMFDATGMTSHLDVLAVLQVLVGVSPYGVHLLGVAFFLAGCVLLHRTVRTGLGALPAFVGLFVLLCLPSQFAWSVSALKEPLFVLLSASSVAMAVQTVRGPGFFRRCIGAAGLVAAAYALESIRAGALGLAAASLLAGVAIAALAMHPRLLVATVMVAPIAAGLALSRPAVQAKMYTGLVAAGGQHWGHVATPGYVYKVMDDRFYPEKSVIADMHLPEMLRYMARALTRYVTAPEPWAAPSRAALGFVPEQILWYVLAAFVPIGLLFALHRDPLIAGLLCGNALVAAVTVALVSGNVGTLIRHRGLALPYLIWLSAVGICECSARLGIAGDSNPAQLH
ncbi:MAG: hypothetical protein JWL71_4131 [Acidobacteria bacterium]|nr:hypothetical protein [Acidobacteriota bacterium]